MAVTDPLPANTTMAGSSQVTYPITESGTYLDQFNARVYTGSNGTLAWGTSAWAEIGDDGDPTSGEVQVRNDISTYMARIQNDLRGLRRQANCSGYTSATLTFVYQRRAFDDANDWVEIQVSPTGAAGSWTTPSGGRFAGPTNDTTNQSASFDISSFISSTTNIRFYSSPDLGRDDSFYFDNVQIALSRRVTSTAPGGDPPNLASGYTLYSGESLTVTFQATVDPNAGPGVTAISNTATVTADGGISQPAGVTNPILPAPQVTAPIYTTDTVISGTSTVIGGTVTVFQNGSPIGTAVVQPDGTWALTGVSGLAAGDAITASVTDGSATSPRSDPVYVLPPPPVVSSPILEGATSVSGTSTAPVGSTITVYQNGSSIGTTTVQAGGVWTLSGISPALVAGDQIHATVTVGGQTSPNSNTVTVQCAPPVVTGPIYASDTSISGTSSSPRGRRSRCTRTAPPSGRRRCSLVGRGR